MNEVTKILVIDDSEDDRQTYRRALQKNLEKKYDIVETATGEDGYEYILNELPDCVLLDYSLPGHNGLEVLKRIRAQHPFVPIVMMTGQGNENVAVAAMQEGAQNYISKSTITPEALKRVVQNAIEHCALNKRIHDQRTSLEIFTRALAHDLKEPVRTIQSFMSLLEPHAGFTDKEKGYFDYIQNAATRMALLIDTVFTYTQLDTSEKETKRKHCDLNRIVEDVKENLYELIKERDATITCGPLPKIWGNRVQLTQLLQNLICNSIRHCETVPIIYLSAEERGNFWLLSVSDNGPGIAQEHRGKIFEPFKRLSRSKVQGLGLGLAISRKIVEAHGGKIRYESKPGEGTTFLFTLSKGEPTVSTMDSKAKAAISNKESHVMNNQPLASILLVEDNEADIELARIMLIEKAGLQCSFHVAHNGYEALEVMHDQSDNDTPIDLILLDINMPGMGGFELLECMKKENISPQIPVVMCTTSTYPKDIENAASLGVKGYLTKPAKLDTLKPVIDALSTIQLCPSGEGFALVRAN